MATTKQQKKDALFWLNVSFKIQAVTSFFILLPMLFPLSFSFLIPGWKNILNDSIESQYSMTIAASIMLSAPILSIWANQKPFERKDILLILCIPAIGFIFTNIVFYSSLINVFQLFLHCFLDVSIISLHLFTYSKASKFS